MLRHGDRVIAAVSGGPDSVCLLRVLCELQERAGFMVTGVAHLNHRLRGEASEEDERFVSELAARFGLPCFCERVELRAAHGNLEQAGRRARIEFFTRLMREGQADRVATGHTRDDQAETVLFRLLRGSGPGGLSGIVPVTAEGLIRPLIDVSRGEVEQFLRSHEVTWREDASNEDKRFARNRIRHELLPQLERHWNPELRKALAQLADLAGEEERWWSRKVGQITAKLVQARDGGFEIRRDVFARLPKVVGRRLVRHLIRQAGGKCADFNDVERILELTPPAKHSGRVEVAGARVIKSFDWLRIEKAAAERIEADRIRVQAPGRYYWHGREIRLGTGAGCDSEAAAKPGGSPCVRLKWKGQSASAILELRGWQDGDRYQPWGRGRVQNIQEMFQKARVPSWRREFWPILTDGCKILWVRDFGPAAELVAESGEQASLCIWEDRETETQPIQEKNDRP